MCVAGGGGGGGTILALPFLLDWKYAVCEWRGDGKHHLSLFKL